MLRRPLDGLSELIHRCGLDAEDGCDLADHAGARRRAASLDEVDGARGDLRPMGELADAEEPGGT